MEEHNHPMLSVFDALQPKKQYTVLEAQIVCAYEEFQEDKHQE